MARRVPPPKLDDARFGRWNKSVRCASGSEKPSARKMEKLRFCLAASVCLAACACAVDVKDAMKNLEGQPLSALLAKLGPPLDERTISGKTVFMWGTPDPTFPGELKDGGRCQIRATMNGDRIAKLEYQGNEKLCAKYTARLGSPLGR